LQTILVVVLQRDTTNERKGRKEEGEKEVDKEG
jgi:hypothetical protein